MAAGIPVNYQENGWLKHFFRIIGVLALVGGIILATLVPDGALPGAIFAGLAVVLLIVNEIHFARRKAAQRFVIDTGCGFRWLGGPTQIEVLDSDVTAVRVERTPQFSAGILQGVVRRFEVWNAAGDKPMCMTNRMAANEADPLAVLVDRVIDDLKQRSAAALADGATLEGDGWRLADMQLTVGRGRKADTLPFGEIDMAAVFDGKFCLWRRGQEERAAKIDPESKNAAVLASLLGDWIAHQREADGGRPEASSGASGMGHLLFERRSVHVFTMYLVRAVHVGLWCMALFFVHHILLVYTVPLALGVFEMVFGRFRFRCYELGVSRRWVSREFRLPYDEITEFTYVAKPMYHLGSYLGTQLNMTFGAAPGTIRYSARVQNPDADVAGLPDRIAKTVATRMLRELRDGREAPWTGDLVLLPEGLRFRRPSRFGLAAGPIEILPYEQIRHVHIDNGVCHLHGKAGARPLISKPVDSVNFFPGYFAVLAMRDVAAKSGQGLALEEAVSEEH